MPEITDALIKQLRADAASSGRTLEVTDTGCKGLRVRVSYGGATGFYILYRPRGEGKVKRLMLGKYPGVGIAEARRIARGKIGDVSKGGDPLEEQRAARQEKHLAAADAEREALAIAGRMTVRQLVERFLHEKRDLRWLPRYRSMLDYNMLAPKLPELQLGIADKAVDDLTGDDIDMIITAIQKRGSDVQARRVFETIRAVVRFGIKKRFLHHNPLEPVSAPANAQPRERFLSVPELQRVWNVLAEWDHGWTINAEDRPLIPHAAVRALRLQLLLACRIGEITGMRKHEISEDGFAWVIPGERTKNGEAHTLPLPPLAREIISAAVRTSTHPTYAFPVHARDGSGWKPLRGDVMSGHVALIQPGFGFTDREGNAAPFVSHDLRRSAATYLRKAGVSSEVVSAILNHKSERKGGVLGKHYDRDDLAYPMREALTRWEGLLQDVGQGKDPFARNQQDIADLERRLTRQTGPRLVSIGGGKA